MNKSYDLSELVAAQRVSGVTGSLIGLILKTRLGDEILGVIDTAKPAPVRDQYRQAMRVLRLRQRGLNLEAAREFSKLVEGRKTDSGLLALDVQLTNKHQMRMFDYLVQLSKGAQ